MIFLKKKYMEVWYILQMFRKDGLYKKIALQHDLSYIMRKDGIFFPENNILFLLTENERWYFSKNTWKYHVFCMLVKVVFPFPINMKLPFCQKSKDDLFPKNTPKDDISGITEKDDIHPREDDIFMYFYGDLFNVFIYCFPIKKPQET